MKRGMLALPAAVGVALLRGADADGNAAKKELDKFNGKWQAVSVERDGKQIP
jgi:hypothetical protein